MFYYRCGYWVYYGTVTTCKRTCFFATESTSMAKDKNDQFRMVITDPLITNVPTKSNGEFLPGVYSKASLQIQKRTKKT